MALIETQIREAVSAAVEPVMRKQEALSARLDALSKPQSRAGVTGESLMFGGAPNIRRGENSMSSRGFSLLRVMALAARQIGPEDAKLEVDLSNRLRERMPALKSSPDAVLMPLGSRQFAAMDFAFSEEIRQSMAAGVAGADPGMIRQLAARGVTQALSWESDNAGGAFVANATQGEPIELLRAKLIFARAGCTELILDSSGKFRLPKLESSTTGYWIGESSAITETEPTTSTVDLIARKIGVLTRLPNELLRYSGPSEASFNAILVADQAAVLARAADTQMLAGAGSAVKPAGLLTYPIGSLAPSASENAEPQDFARLLGALEDADVDIEDPSCCFVMRGGVFWDCVSRRADAVSASDGAGPFVFQVNREQMAAGQPPMILGKRVLTSSAVPDDLPPYSQTSSSAAERSVLIAGVFRHWVIAMQPALEVALSNQAGSNTFLEDQSLLRSLCFIDARPRHYAAFAKISGIRQP